MKHPAFGFAVLAVLLLITSALPCSAKTVYVKWDSPGPTFDGASWDRAFHTVQAGLDAASEGDEVWVARGTYVENITLKLGVGLYGGFVGTEMAKDERDWSANVAILDGNQAGSVVISPRWATSATRIDGFTIRNGKAGIGGGILCIGSSPTIINNLISENLAGYGGGIACMISSSSTIANNTIALNSASLYGGGIYCAEGGSPDISDNVITENSTPTGSGGGVFCGRGSSPTIRRNTITGNTAPSLEIPQARGGGIFCYASAATITNNLIAENSAASAGGGVYSGDLTHTTIADNTITQNNAPLGGGVYCGVDTVTGNVITENSANSGGGVYSVGSSLIANNRISGNSAHDGGGICCSAYHSARIFNNTIAENDASTTGGGIRTTGGSSVWNNIVAFNSSGVYAGPTELRNNCVYGNASYDYLASAGAGDISVDPLFSDRTAGDYHIKLTSPCVNAGRNEAVYPADKDIDGESRILYGTVDIGADECSGVAGVLKEAKMVANSIPVQLADMIVTAAFDGCFYIEAEDRSCGVRVEKAAHGVEAGDKVNVTGILKTNADGERYIEASSVEVTGTGSIRPVFINSRAIGGSGWFYNPSTGAGQCGVVDGLGLNNIGLLVTTWGKLNYLGGGYALDKTAKILAEGMSLGGETYVRITGISSCYRDADGLHPTIRVTEIKPL